MADQISVTCVDNDLVHRARKGDVGAFEELFRRHQKRVYNISFQMLSDETEAADATQEVFVRAYRSITRLKSDAAFVTWLKTLTVNLCRDVLRKRKRAVRVESLDKPLDTDEGSRLQPEIEDWSANPEQLLGKKEVRETVQTAVTSLSPEYREVISLFYVDGAEVTETAKRWVAPSVR